MEKIILEGISVDELVARIQNVFEKRIRSQKAVDLTDDILTVDQVCEEFKISKSTLHKKTSRNEIPFFKVGSRLRFKRTLIAKWFDNFYKSTDQDFYSK